MQNVAASQRPPKQKAEASKDHRRRARVRSTAWIHRAARRTTKQIRASHAPTHSPLASPPRIPPSSDRRAARAACRRSSRREQYHLILRCCNNIVAADVRCGRLFAVRIAYRCCAHGRGVQVCATKRLIGVRRTKVTAKPKKFEGVVASTTTISTFSQPTHQLPLPWPDHPTSPPPLSSAPASVQTAPCHPRQPREA